MSIKPKPFVNKMIASTLLGGLDALDKEAEPYIPEDLKTAIDALPLPEDFKTAILPLASKGVSSPIGAIVVMLIGMSLGTALGVAAPLSSAVSMKLDRLIQTYRFDPGTITRLYLRGFPSEDEKDKWWDDLREQGWSPEKVEAAKELVNIIPPLADMVRFADFSAFDEEVIEKWREFYDAPDWIRGPFSLLGVTGEWASKYWFSHWIQPGRYEQGEMHRRGLVSDDDVKLAYKTMGYSGFWQDKLLELVKAVPTRVDVRRWWDMRTIDEARLREIYHAQGYYGKDLDDYVVWTKVYTDFPDLIARYKNGWINLDEVQASLLADGMPEDRMIELLETKFKRAAAPERVAAERNLTKTDITMAVKKEIIPYDKGIELLMDLGYDAEEASYIIDARVSAAGSPESYLEFKKLTQSYRHSQGLEYKEIPSEVLASEKTLSDLRLRLSEAISREAEVEEIDQLKVELAEAETRYSELASLHGL